MADLPGPKMRIGSLEREPVELKAGSTLVLTSDDITGNESRVSTSFPSLPHAVKPGDKLFVNDGLIQLEVRNVTGNDVDCQVLAGGELRSRKGLNLPGIDLGISAFTEHDRDCLKFALENGVDAVGQSFVESARDVQAVRDAAASIGYKPFVIAKIERSRALDRIEEIIEAADGILVARGDLGVELPIEQIAVIQKRVIRLANRRAKPVITATQMLESMISSRRPTRAEATDVANSILDGTDCVMLSAESAVGNYPVEAVTTLARIAAATEPFRAATSPKEMFKGIDLRDRVQTARLIDLGVETVLEYSSRALVFVPTDSGVTPRSIARFRLPTWIIAVCSDEPTCRHLQFSSGVYAAHELSRSMDWNNYCGDWIRRHGMQADLAIVTSGRSAEYPDANFKMEIVELVRSKKKE